MIRENGLYVLMGSKPMSTFYIDGYPETEEELSRCYQNYLATSNKDDSPMNYEEFKESYKEQIHLHHRHLWKIWQEKKYPISQRYQFAARKAPFGDSYIEGLFINVPNTLYILKTHYDSFSRITGMVFDPDKILEEISDNTSIFWEKAFRSHHLMGLMFGYGNRNAICYDWEVRADLPERAVNERDIDEIVELAMKRHITPKDLQLPRFGVYAFNDAMSKRYKKEKEFILKQFRGKDFCEVVMNWLSGDKSISSLHELQ